MKECWRVRLRRGLRGVGLGYLSLGQPLTTLSGGERQRRKLAIHMATDGGIYVLDEPTSGLHLADVEQLLGLLDRLSRLRQDGHRDRAPPGGDSTRRLARPRPGASHHGGQVVFEGTPAEIVADRSTLTGQHLAAYVRVSRHPALTDPPRPTNS